jgi:hypothetical protein
MQTSMVCRSTSKSFPVMQPKYGCRAMCHVSASAWTYLPARNESHSIHLSQTYLFRGDTGADTCWRPYLSLVRESLRLGLGGHRCADMTRKRLRLVVRLIQQRYQTQIAQAAGTAAASCNPRHTWRKSCLQRSWPSLQGCQIVLR